MRAVVAAALALTLMGNSCTRTPVRVPSRMPEPMTFTTQDNVRIAADWYPVAQPKTWVLLLHMMPATKESFARLASALQGQGIASLAIDFRGHGASAGGPDGYERFSDAEQQAKVNDVTAAVDWLAARGAAAEHLVVVGASIGANLALQWLVAHTAAPAAVLLSPGLDYRGITTEPLASHIAGAQRVFLAAGGTDDAYSTQTVQRLTEILGDRATTRIVNGFGHGTAVLDDPAFRTEIVRWITQQVR